MGNRGNRKVDWIVGGTRGAVTPLPTPLYLDRGRKSLVHAEIGEQLNTTGDEVAKKIRNMDSYYCQLRREARDANVNEKEKQMGPLRQHEILKRKLDTEFTN